MPELPEVETIKRNLEKKILGQKIKKIDILNRKSFKGNKKIIIGAKIKKIKRRGKILIFKLDNNFYLAFHLKMSGQLLVLDSFKKINKKDLKTTRVVFYLNKNVLLFNDARKFGWVKVLDKKRMEEELKNLGKEALMLNFNYLKDIFSKTSRPIKLVLTDQRKIAGIGNIYANEALFLAKIHPQTPANKLTDRKIKKLLKAIKTILKKAIKYEGTSFRFYLKPDESRGKYQEKFLVYQREDEKCKRCSAKIKRIILGGRSTFYCPNCQK